MTTTAAAGTNQLSHGLYPGLALAQAEPGVWRGDIPRLPPGEYSYKILVDGWRWLDDPANPDKRWDGRAGFDSVFFVPL